jgi:RHS repeat-associated protein
VAASRRAHPPSKLDIFDGGPAFRLTTWVTGLVVAAAAAVVAPIAPAAAVVPRAATPAPVRETFERPDLLAAQLTAAATGREVLVTGETTETSLTWARPDGSLRSEVSPVAVRVAQPDGSWADVDYDLTRVEGGWAPKHSPADVVFSAGGDNPAVTLDHGSRGLELSWASALPEPTIDGNNAIYQLTDNEALVLSATSDGFEQFLKLSAPPSSAPKQRLGFDMTGLTMVENTTGGYDFVKTSAAGEPSSSVVFTMPKPRMFSSLVVDDERVQSQTIPVSLKSGEDGAQYLDLGAGMPFLTDPATVYPVWIDPTVSSVSRYGDTYVTQADADSHVSDSELRIGMSSNGNLRRSLIRFDTAKSVPSRSHVTSASLKLYNNTSSTCAARSMTAYPITESYTMTSATWANQPSYSTSSSYSASASFSYGNEGLGCNNATGSITVTNMVQAWVNGTLTDYGLMLRSGSETDASYAKYFCSMNIDPTGDTACSLAARYPTLTVVYNSYPGAPASGTFSPKVSGTTIDSYLNKARTFSTSLTPAFTAKLANADGAKVALQVKLSHDVNYASQGTGEITTITSAAVNPGANASVTVPAGKLAAGQNVMYQMRARVTNGAGGYDYSAWTPSSLTSTTSTKFALNTTLPDAPTISCGAFPAGVWTVPASTATSCTFDTTSTDGSGYYWGLDDPATPNLATDSSNTGAAVAASISTKTLGWHTLYVRSRDTALRQSSSTTAYQFGVGAGGVLSPAAGASTAKGVALSSSANSGYTRVTYQWAAGTTSTTWTDLPLKDVTPAGSSTPITQWPLTGAAAGNLTAFTGYNWNVAATLAAVGEPDGALRVRAKFTTATGTVNYSAERTFALAVTTFGQNAATEAIGPGEVSLTTGDFLIGDGDATVGGLSVGRSATSLSPAAASTGATGVFGPGWRASLEAEAFDDSILIDNAVSGSMTIQTADGTELVYVKQADGAYAGSGEAADGSTLVRSTTIRNPASAADTVNYTGWQLTEAGGTVTTWLKNAAGSWLVAWVDHAGEDNETSYARDTSGRVTTILGATPDGVTCTTTSFSAAGCSALQLSYATATTATGTAEAAWGSFTGLLTGVTWTGYDPAASAMVTKQIATYQYDSTGHLRAAWDPRLSTPLKTRYTYDANGRVATLTPPGLAPWTMSYDAAGRLASVSRTDPANGAATQAVVYDLPVSGLTGAPDVSGATAATWGQVTDLPYSGAAVFPASHVPAAGNAGAYAPAAADWPYGRFTYADVNGRVVGTAAFGAGAWQIDSTRYDDYGNETWTLDAGNRAQALTPTAGTDPYVASQNSSAARADLLATIKTYSDDGVDLISELGPAHPAQLSNGEVASVRVKTTRGYDSGAPNATPYHLITKSVTTPVALDGSVVPAADTRTTVIGYAPVDGSSVTGATSGWTLNAPTTETTWMGSTASSSADLTARTRYDSTGRVVEARLPGGGATDANTTITTYYSTAANSTYSACGGKPYWAGLVCRTDAGGSPSAGYAVPSKTYTYDLYGQTLTTTETSGAVVRTTATSYDTIGRPAGSGVTVTGLPSSVATPATTIQYDAGTGIQTATIAGPATIAGTYDTLGRQVTYTDADGVTTTRTFDVDGNLAAVNDGKGVYSFTYDSAMERRGKVTSLNAGMGALSTFTGTYDAAGNLSTQTYPNGAVAAYAYDNTGDTRGLSYTFPAVGGSTPVTLAMSSTTDAFGNTAHAESGASAQDYTFDNAGRLTQVADYADGTCTVRSYGYDQQSGRTSLTTYAGTADGDCQKTTAASTVSTTYDTANRIVGSGYTYDQLGRTLTVPKAAMPTGEGTSVSYYHNDMTAGLTQATTGKAFTLDPENRYRQVKETLSGAETERIVNHYAGGGDSPSWIATSTNAGSSFSWARNVIGLNEGLATIQYSDGTSAVQLTNLHGDVIGILPNQVPTAENPAGAAPAATFEATEYGTSRDYSSEVRYGWLGEEMRSGDAVGGLMLMGARLYNPAAGTFLSTDSIAGGNANSYTYPDNPIDEWDVDGRGAKDCKKKKLKWCGVIYNRSGHDLMIANKRNGGGKRCELPTGQNSNKWPCYMIDVDSFMNPDGFMIFHFWYYGRGKWANLYAGLKYWAW